MQDNKPVYQVQACTQEEVDACFKAAKEAQRDWAKVQHLQFCRSGRLHCCRMHQHCLVSTHRQQR
jgi:hypothetical protein